MNAIKSFSLALVLIGVLIVIFPQLVGIIIGVLLIIVGVNGLAFGARVNRFWKIKIDR